MAKDLRTFLEQLKSLDADNFAEVTCEIDPNKFEVTAILEHLTKADKYPLVKFANPKDAPEVPGTTIHHSPFTIHHSPLILSSTNFV
jgi:hypothetical protein